MRPALLIFIAMCLAWAHAGSVRAQTAPGLVTGQVPTATQWNSYFADKVDYNPAGIPVTSGGTGSTTSSGALTNLGGLPSAGGSMTGLLDLNPSSSGGAGLNCGAGAAPSSPSASDLWCTNAGVFYRAGSTTQQLANLLGVNTWALTQTMSANLGVTGGEQVGSPTGGYEGAGTVNVASNYYLNGVAFGNIVTQNTATFAQVANNLSDLASVSTARTNLGLGTAAQQNVAAFLQTANNGSDIASASAFRGNLGLGSAALVNTGTSGATLGLLNGGLTFSGADSFTAGLTVTTDFTATGLVTNADMVNDFVTVNGQTCVFGAGCTVAAAAASMAVGTTNVTGGTNGHLLGISSGVLADIAVTGSGSAVLATSPTLVTPNLGVPSVLTLTNATGLPNASVIGLGTAALINTGTSGGTPFIPLHVVNNTALSALAHTAATTIIRDGFASVGDTPPLLFNSSSSPCSIASGAGDGGSQVPTSDGGCWLAVFNPLEAPLSEWVGAIGSSTDITTQTQAALTALTTTGIPLLVDGRYLITNITIPIGVTVEGVAGQQSDNAATIFTNASAFLCANSAVICVARHDVSGSNETSGIIRDLDIIGNLSVPASGGIGLQIKDGYGEQLNNVKVAGFDTCIKYLMTGLGETAWADGLWTASCSNAHIMMDGWGVLYIHHFFAGDRLPTPNIASTSVFEFTNQSDAGTSSQGPNTFVIDDYQINPPGGTIYKCTFDFRGFQGTAGVASALTEFKSTNGHIEYNNSTTTSGSGIICADNTLLPWNSIGAINQFRMVNNSITEDNSLGFVPWFNLDPSITLRDDWFIGNEIQVTGTSTIIPLSNIAAIIDVHFDHNYWTGAVSVNSNYSKYVATTTSNSMSVASITTGAGPILYGPIIGTGIPAKTYIAYDGSNETGSHCNGSPCTGVDGTTTGTFGLNQAATASSATITQDVSSDVFFTNNTEVGTFTLSGLWPTRTGATGCGIKIDDSIAGAITDSSSGNVCWNMPWQAFTPQLSLCTDVSMLTCVAANTNGSQTASGAWKRTIDGGGDVEYNISLSGVTTLSTNPVLGITGLPSKFGCAVSPFNFGTTSYQVSGNDSGMTGLTGPIINGFSTSGVPNGIALKQQGATGTSQLANTNITTTTGVRGGVHCQLMQ